MARNKGAGATRRDVLKGGGALLACAAVFWTRPKLLLADEPAGSATDAMLELEPVGRLPDRLRARPWNARPAAAPRLLAAPDTFGLLRARDLLELRVHQSGLDLARAPRGTFPGGACPAPGRGAVLLPRRGADARLVFELTPQALSEASWHDPKQRFPTRLDGPVRAWLSGSSRLAFTVPTALARPVHGVPWSTDGLLEWDRLEPRLVPRAVPDLDVLGPDGQRPRPPSGADRMPSAPPEDRTALELPTRILLSPNEWVAWRFTSNRAALTAPHTPLELWHAIAGAPHSFDSAHVATERDDLRTLRAIWWRETRCAEPVRWVLPSDPDRRQLVHLSSHFGLGAKAECGRRPPAELPAYVPAAIPFRRLALSARGATVSLQGRWNPSVPKPAEGDPPYSVQEWKQDTVLGRDQFVKVVHKGYLWPFGHEASVVAVARRVVKHLDVRGTVIPVAFLLRETWVEVRQPTVTYPAIPDGVPEAGRSCPFREVTLRTLQTPSLQRRAGVLHASTRRPGPDPSKCAPQAPPPAPEDDEANWRAYAMIPVGASQPFPFEIEATDHQGQRVAFRMPLVWVHLYPAERELDANGDLLPNADLAPVLAAISRRTAERTADLAGQAVNLVPAELPGTSGAAERDHAVEVLRMVFAAETPTGETKGLISAPAGAPYPWHHSDLPATAPKWLAFHAADVTGKRALPDSRPCLAWSPALLAARVRLPDAGVMGAGEPAPEAWIAWHDAYLACGFDPKANPAAVYARVLPSAPAPMRCDPERGGGLVSPSGEVIGLSRSTGIVTGPRPKDEPVASVLEPRCGAPADPASDPATGSSGTGTPDDPLIQYSLGAFDPTAIFRELNPKLLGAVRLSDVIAPLKDFQQAIEKVPRLLKEKLGPVVELVEQVRSKKALLEGAVEALRQLPAGAEALLKKLREQVLPEAIKPLLEPFRQIVKSLDDPLGTAESQLLLSLRGVFGRLETAARDHALDTEAKRAEVAAVLAVLRQELRKVLLLGQAGPSALAAELRQFVPDLPGLRGDRLPWDRLAGVASQVFRTLGEGLVGVVRGLLGLDPATLLEPIRSLLAQPTDVLGLPRRLERALVELEQRLRTAEQRLERIEESARDEAFRLQGVLQETVDALNPVAILDEAETLIDAWVRLVHRKVADLFTTGSAWGGGAEVAFRETMTLLEGMDAVLEAVVAEPVTTLRGLLEPLRPNLSGVATAIESTIRNFSGIDDLRKALSRAFATAASTVSAMRREVEALRARLPKSIDVRYDWDLPLKDGPGREPIFLASTGRCAAARGSGGGRAATFKIETVGRLSLDGGPSVEVEARLENFSLNLLPSVSFLCVEFERVSLRGGSARKPDVEVRLANVIFGEKLKWVKELAEALSPRNGFFLTLDGGGILAGFRFALPTITSGALNLIDLAFEVGLRLPFEADKELRLRAAVSSRARPFMVTVGVLGGGGHFAVELSPTGLKAFELTLEFGATVALDLGIARGQVYVRAGIFYSKNDEGTVRLFAYIRAGGSLEILGFIRVTVEFYLALEYYEDTSGSRLEGVARVHVEIEILFFSISVTLEVRRTISGSGGGSGGGFDALADVVEAFGGAADRPKLPAETAAADPVFDEVSRASSARERVRWKQAHAGWREYRRQFARRER